MSYSLESLKGEAWTAFAAVKLCKALEAAYTNWKLHTSSPTPTDIGTTAKLVHRILESEDETECKKDIAQVSLDIQTSHTYWSGCVRESWELLKPELDKLPESRCEHEEGKMCTSCKLLQRTTTYGFLWADFVTPSVSGDSEYLKLTEVALDNTLMIVAARGEHAENGGTSHLQAVSSGEEALLVQLGELSSTGEPHPHVAYWRELLQNLVEYSPTVRTRVKNRHEYEATFEPGVAAVDA